MFFTENQKQHQTKKQIFFRKNYLEHFFHFITRIISYDFINIPGVAIVG